MPHSGPPHEFGMELGRKEGRKEEGRKGGRIKGKEGGRERDMHFFNIYIYFLIFLAALGLLLLCASFL